MAAGVLQLCKCQRGETGMTTQLSLSILPEEDPQGEDEIAPG